MARVKVTGTETRIMPPHQRERKPRPVYVYLVEFTVPEDKEWPWSPPEWRGEFHWPNKKHCLTLNTAQRWANHMDTLGAVNIRIRRSEQVRWTDGDS